MPMHTNVNEYFKTTGLQETHSYEHDSIDYLTILSFLGT